MRVTVWCIAVLFALSSFAEAESVGPYCRANIRHIERGGIGYDEGYTTFETFLAPTQEVFTPFLDVRGHLFDDGKWAANGGTGLRALCGERVYGINAYYDYRRVKHFNANQIGIGCEMLGACLDFRLNGYLPVGRKTSDPYDAVFEAFSGHYLLLSEKVHSAMKGGNAECGLHLGKTRWFDLYAAAGPYYFIGEVTPATWGARARIASTFHDLVILEISDSYDRTFRNRFQGQVTLSFSFGPCSKRWKDPCCPLVNRRVQPVYRDEIIVVDKAHKEGVAIDPETGLPFFFVFVDNTSASAGTYESPYPTLAQAQENSSPNDILYVFPGDGTTTGMDSGIALQANQKFWGSGVSHVLQTTQGAVSLPAQSSLSPTITNTDDLTDGNAIDLATNNAISGFTITGALNDAIFGSDPQSVEVSSCTIENSSTFAIEAYFSSDASVSLTDNQFVDNTNGPFFSFEGASTVLCSDNVFSGQTSESNFPLALLAENNALVATIENNVFEDNTTGCIQMHLDNVSSATLNVTGNTMTNNGTGAQSTLGSSIVMLSEGTIGECTLVLNDNTFSGNASECLYFHTSGAFTTLDVTASSNQLSDSGGGGFVLATPTENLTLIVTDNVITGCEDNGVAVIASGTTTTGAITISNNSIADIGNASNGIGLFQDFSTLSLKIVDNTIDTCEGTGIISYAPTMISSLTVDIADNTITNCENLSSNAAAGIDLEQYIEFEGALASNTLSGNAGLDVFVGSSLTAPTACLTLSGNASSNGYLLSNPGDGTFLLSPCDVNAVNTGTINTSGTIDLIQSCSNPIPCSPSH